MNELPFSGEPVQDGLSPINPKALTEGTAAGNEGTPSTGTTAGNEGTPSTGTIAGNGEAAGQLPKVLCINEPLVPAEELDEDFDQPYHPVEIIKLPIREQDLPVPQRQLIATAPAKRKVPIFISSLSPLGALATRIRLVYIWDIHPHAILLQVIIEAPPSTGKRCFAEVVRVLIGPTLEALDQRQRRAEQEYRERKNARAQNEKIGEAPKTTIRCIPPATSKTIIVKRADLYDRLLGDTLTFWMWAEELAQLGDAGKSGFSNLRTVMRIAYDLGSKFGQDFASDNSYSGNADVCICSMFCATPQDVDEIYTRKEVMGGGASRVILVSLEDEIGARPALFRPLTSQEQQLVSSALQYLMEDTYTPDGQLQPTQVLDTRFLDPVVSSFCTKMAKRAAEMKDAGMAGAQALDHYYKRASVNAFRSTGLVYYLYRIENRMADAGVEGAIHRSEEQIRRLCIKIYRFLAHYCLNANNNRWGRIYEEGYRKQKQGAKVDARKPLIDQLTTVFTRDQLSELIRQNELDTEERHFIAQWKAKGWIIKLRKNVYQKQR